MKYTYKVHIFFSPGGGGGGGMGEMWTHRLSENQAQLMYLSFFFRNNLYLSSFENENEKWNRTPFLLSFYFPIQLSYML